MTSSSDPNNVLITTFSAAMAPGIMMMSRNSNGSPYSWFNLDAIERRVMVLPPYGVYCNARSLHSDTERFNARSTSSSGPSYAFGYDRSVTLGPNLLNVA